MAIASSNRMPTSAKFPAVSPVALSSIDPFIHRKVTVLHRDAPLSEAAQAMREKSIGCVLVSDNESWIYQGRPYFYGASGSTGVVTEWQQFVQNQVRLQGGDIVGPKLICIDLQPNATAQAPERSDILNVGGFSDAVFDVISAFLSSDAGRFVAEVESVKLQLKH